MEQPHYICNLKKSPKDNRDFIFASKSKNDLPEIVDYRLELQPIRNQGKQGTCYAQSTACMKEWQEKKDNNFNEYMSPQFFYNNRSNKYDDNPNNDDGMYGRDVMKLIKNIGICPESSYIYGRVEPKKDIPQYIYDEAKKYIIKSYAKVETLENLKQSLVKNGPCLVAFPVYNYGNQFWRKTTKQHKGGHAVTIVGYNKDGFIIRNSWGTKWGDEGYSIYRYEDWGSHWEIWTTIDLDLNDIYIPKRKNKCKVCEIL
jgi:C1A family cysteine protease